MLTNTHWFWFVLGFIPYWTDRKYIRGGWRLEIHALCWTFTIERRIYKRKRSRWTRTNWRFRLPIIEKLRQAVWAAVISLRQ